MAELAAECDGKLASGIRALDVVEYAVAELESSGMYVAGRGSAPNSAGYVELDASIMDGRSRDAGAVAAVVSVVNPVKVARRVMEDTPHVMLVSKGAREFATEHGMDLVDDPENYYVLPVGVYEHELREQEHGTVGAVALDTSGGLAAATSTGGTFGKLEGRVGDSPLIGPGTWADDQIAISCTGTGEQIILAGGALAVAYKVRAGLDTGAAIDEMLAEVKSLGGDGGVIAVTRKGEIAMRYNSQGMKRAWIKSGKSVFATTFD